MNKADPLIAAFRQLANAKMISRVGPPGAVAAKDGNGKEKADHFREQLRLIAHGTKPGAKVDKADAEMEVTKDTEPPERVANVADDVAIRPESHERQLNDTLTAQVSVDTRPLPTEWRGPEAALSAVISKLDQAKPFAARGDDAAPRVVQSQPRSEERDMPLTPDDPIKIPDADSTLERRFAVSMNAAETRMSPAVKVVVREQETHFEPVQQVTLLQKIVDRMGADLSAPSTSTRASSADIATPDIHRVADKPVKMLTLQLDPPDLGAVTVKMRMAGNAVEVRLTADRYETAQMLQNERSALTDVMQSAGYAFDVASIDHSRASDANPGAGQQQAQQDQRSSPQQQSGAQINNATSERQPGDAQSGARHNRQQQHDQFAEPMERHREKEIVRDRNSGAVYL